MRRIENIVLTVAAVVIGFSVLAYNLAGAIFPEALDVPKSSYLENRFYTGCTEITPKSVSSGEFQESLDACLADHVPARNQVVLYNALLQRASIATSAGLFGFDVYPTFLGSRYYVIPRDNLIVDRAEEQPSDADAEALEAWVSTLNGVAQNHPNINFVYDCIARHDQCEANPTYQYYSNRLDPTWAQANIIDRLNPHLNAFVDPVESYDEIVEEWYNADPHWTLKRALESYNKIAERLNLTVYPYDNPVVAVDSWHGGYAKNGLDLDVSTKLEDLPIDFSQLSFYRLQEEGGGEISVGSRDGILSGQVTPSDEVESMYYEYFGGGQMEVRNSGANNGRNVLVITDSLSYSLTRFIASNYDQSTFILPGNDHFGSSFEEYIERYKPDDVIVLTHVSKYISIAEFSPEFIGLPGVSSQKQK